jgi:hypothetical protein
MAEDSRAALFAKTADRFPLRKAGPVLSIVLRVPIAAPPLVWLYLERKRGPARDRDPGGSQSCRLVGRFARPGKRSGTVFCREARCG